jgi:deazaflavin-dependent oxidoreductase (nitroreductase family)
VPEKIKDIQPPHGLARLGFRLPIVLYRLGLGGMLGTRFLLLTHTGRRSGLTRHTVLEVVRYDQSSGECIIASGWGYKSDWLHNITANPHVSFQVGMRRTGGIAQRLAPEEAGQEFLDYSRQHPLAFHELVRFMGFKLDGSEADTRALGRRIPIFLLKPK